MQLPMPGTLWVLTKNLNTPAGNYEKGDLFGLLEPTTESPFNFKSGISNWWVKTKHGTSVWATIWILIDRGGLIKYEPDSVPGSKSWSNKDTNFLKEMV